MGEALLRNHVQTIKARLGSLPGPPKVQRLDLEDNVVEFRINYEVDVHSERGKRFNFLVYDADAYPHSGGVIMSEDERDEALVEAMNARLRDPDNATISDALCAACAELKVEDPALIACFNAPLNIQSKSLGEEHAQQGDANVSPKGTCDVDKVYDDEDDLCFEGEDDECNSENYSSYIGPVVDRENRPGWKKLKWQETEELRVARRKEHQPDVEPGQKRRKAGGGDMTLEEQKAAAQQMWSSQEAFTILANELFQLQTVAEATLEADAVDYNVYQWIVRIRGCSGPLGEDLQELQRLFGYDYIELRLRFKEDLHPFYPPSASVVRPRLQGNHDVLAALACHPRLQLRGWSPFQTTADLLSSICHFLESIARVDLSNEQNDLQRFPAGAFSQLECELAQLGNLCEIVPIDLQLQQDGNPYQNDPWAQNQMLTQTSLGAMQLSKKAREPSSLADNKKTNEVCATAKEAPTFWAAGTGYGHDHPSFMRETWDPQAMKAAQEAQDDELKALVKMISRSLAAAASKKHVRVERSSSSSSTADVGDASQIEAAALSGLLAKSCLVLFLVRELSISYTNMGDRLLFFKEVYNLVRELLLALPDHAGHILAPVRPHMVESKSSAQTFLQSLGDQAGRADLVDDVSFAKLAVQICDDVEKLCAAQGLSAPQSVGNIAIAMNCSSSPDSSARPAMYDEEEADYTRVMKGKQFDYCDFVNHTFADSAAQEPHAPQARTLRLAKELAGLTSLLPLSGSSSVIVRIDNQRQQLWRVMVTGPDDTPYSNGCFIFDCYFPMTYPSEPPKVLLLTTGNNTVTFNPNLYDSGKVCLSLLGTWKGEKAESWDPVNSRMLQVLVSIQSLILVPEPYFNEPGFEREIGTRAGEHRSREYSQPVREGNLKWAMLDLIQRVPFMEFREVIKLHFRLRARKIKETVSDWVAEAESPGAAVHRASLMALQRDLLVELEKLQVGPLNSSSCLPCSTSDGDQTSSVRQEAVPPG